ncbi:MAG: type II secretion system secretin GspD [bacterium]
MIGPSKLLQTLLKTSRTLFFMVGRSLVIFFLFTAILTCAADERPLAVSSPQATVDFTFSQVDVRSFVKIIGEITGRRFLVDEAVKGQITVVAPRVPVAEAYQLFTRILETVGCAVVEDGSLYRVVVLPSRTIVSAPVIGESGAIEGNGVITRVIRLKYTNVSDLRKIIDTLTGREKGASAAIVESSNHIILTDTVGNIRRFEQIIAEIDKAGVGTMSEVVFLKNADAAEFVRQYNQAIGPRPMIREGVPAPRGSELVMVSTPQSNSIIMIGPAAEIAAVKKLLEQVDVETSTGGGNLHAIFLKYISADEAAKSLNALLERSLGKEPPKAGERRKLSVAASTANNALLVDASPMDFQLLQTLVMELDQLQDQVLIEVVIAEVSADESLDVGVEMTALNSPTKVGDSVIQGSTRLSDNPGSINDVIQNGVFPRGIMLGVARGSRLDSSGNVVSGYPGLINLNALQAKGKVKILSSVPLVSQNNKEASVSVVNNIPILKSTIQGGSGTARDVIQNIERMDVGIKLKLTPHVNPSNEVCMVLNPSIEAIIDAGAAGSYTPTIAKREVSTTVTVPDGRTIVISGLIREDRSNIVRKIPLLGSIPLIGILFRHTVESKNRTNLIIFVTPHVMSTEANAKAATDLWSRKTGLNVTNNDASVTGPPDPSL